MMGDPARNVNTFSRERQSSLIGLLVLLANNQPDQGARIPYFWYGFGRSIGQTAV